VPINIKGVSSNPVHGEMYSIQQYVIKFDSDYIFRSVIHQTVATFRPYFQPANKQRAYWIAMYQDLACAKSLRPIRVMVFNASVSPNEKYWTR
jgi:hypothetical protein